MESSSVERWMEVIVDLMEKRLTHFHMCDWICFGMAFLTPHPGIYTFFFIISRNMGTGGSTQRKVSL